MRRTWGDRVPRWRCAVALVAGLVLVAAVPADAAGPWKVEAGTLNTSVRLEAVTCPSMTFCAAVGFIGNNSQTFKVDAETRNGSKWSVVPSSGPTGSMLNGVSCPAEDWCQAVGTYGNLSGPLTEHWDGQKWSQSASPVPSDLSDGLNGVACTSRTWCVAVGDRFRHDDVGATLIEQWNGSRWSVVPSPNRGTVSSTLYAVSCVSPEFCTAGGYSEPSSGTSQTLFEMWNGKAWRIVPSPNPPGRQFIYLNGVDCVATTWCMAVGYAWSGSIIEKWNGQTWHLVAHPTANTAYTWLRGVSCISRASCNAVGNGDNGPIAQSWNGTVWSSVAVPPRPLLRSVSCVSATLCKAVGDGSIVETTS